MFDTAIFLNVLSLAVVSAWFALLLQLLVSGILLRKIALLPAWWQKSLLSAWVLLPLVVGVVCSGAFMLYAFTDIIWAPLEMFIHWHHLFEFEWFTWHGSLLMVWAIATTLILMRHIRFLHQHHQSLCNVTLMADGAPERLNEYHYVCLDTAIPLAFTAGILKPQVYLSKGLKELFTRAELECILAHETAHQRRFDPLQKWLFSLVSAYYPGALRKQLRQSFELASELYADSQAGKKVGALNVASALVSYRKSAQSCQLPFAFAFGQDFVTQRVHALLQPAPFQFQVPVVISLAALAVLLTNLLSMDSLHHYIELILPF